MPSLSATDNAVAQGIAAQVDYLESTRAAELVSTLERILVSETDELTKVASRETQAALHLDLARINAQGVIDANRGNARGMHGFIAEYAEEGVANAERAIDGLKPLTKALADNGRADLSVDGISVQMKFYADPKLQLHRAADYRDMKMMFPQNHLELFDRIMQGETHFEVDGSVLSARKVNAIRELIEQESAARGESYTNWMEPSKLEYAEVQRGAIDGTLNEKTAAMHQRAEEQRQRARDDSDRERVSAAQQAAPSWGEAAKVGAAAAAVQGALSLGAHVYRRHRDGISIWEFSKDDWREAGVETAKGGLKGGVSGLAIYGLTQVCRMGAPAAAAVTSGTIGLATAVAHHRAGKLNDDEFADLVFFNAIEATGAAVGAGLGHVLIPIPVLGAVVGSVAASTILSQGKAFLSEAERDALRAREAEIQAHVDGLDAELQAEFVRIVVEHDCYRDLQKRAFDVTANVELQLLGSIELTRSLGVAEGQILHTVAEADAYFLGAAPAQVGASALGDSVPV